MRSHRLTWMDSWNNAFDRVEASEMLSPSTGGDAGISVPVHLTDAEGAGGH